MKNYYRATITIPTDVYRKTKVKAARQNKSVSKFVSDLLLGTTMGTEEEKNPQLPLGKYSFPDRKKFDRKAIYETYLRGKVSP